MFWFVLLEFVVIIMLLLFKQPVVQKPAPKSNQPTGRNKRVKYYSDGDSEQGTSSGTDNSSSESNSESESSEGGRTHRSKKSKSRKDEFTQRACRSKKSVSYRFEEYDELIMDAIDEDLSIPKEPKPRKVKPRGKNAGDQLELSNSYPYPSNCHKFVNN